MAAETPLFDDIVLTSLERSPSGGLRPTLVFAASGTTASSSQQTAAVLEFTWADADDDSILSSAADAFTFTLTQDDGVRCFGFCRRLAQPAKPPVCLCVLSRRPWFSLCARVLDFLKPHVDAHATLVPELMAAARAAALPPPGGLIQLPTAVGVLRLQVPREAADVAAGCCPAELLSALGVGNALRVLGALMSEQRVVFIGDKWGRVSACAHAALSMLYPLRWQHICIPVLPTSKLSYASAPMPFVLGVLSRHLPLLEKEPLEGILFADLESGRLWGDADVMAAATLPKPHVEPFASVLKKVMRKAKESGGPVDDFAVGEAALRFMASLLGHYRQHVRRDDAAPPAVGCTCVPGTASSLIVPD